MNRPFENIAWKGEKIVFYTSQKIIQFLSHIYLIICRCFKLDKSKILLWVKGLKIRMHIGSSLTLICNVCIKQFDFVLHCPEQQLQI